MNDTMLISKYDDTKDYTCKGLLIKKYNKTLINVYKSVLANSICLTLEFIDGFELHIVANNRFYEEVLNLLNIGPNLMKDNFHIPCKIVMPYGSQSIIAIETSKEILYLGGKE